MARARNIKPGFFKNEQLVELAFDRRLLFVGLWMLADRAGKLEDRPKRIKMEVFPGDDVNVDKALDDLHRAGFIIRYKVGDDAYIKVVEFLKHQNPHHREPPSVIPEPSSIPPEPQASPPSQPPPSIPPKPEALPPYQPPKSLGINGHGTTPKPESSPGPAEERHGLALLNPDSGFLNPESGRKPARRSALTFLDGAPPGFVAFWTAWPKSHRKASGEQCRKLWEDRRLEPDAMAILAHVEAMKRSSDWTKDRGDFVPAPIVYLRSARWSGADLTGTEPGAGVPRLAV